MSKPSTLLILLAARILTAALPYLLPYGPAVDIPPQNRPAISKVDPTNISLQMKNGKLTKIYERFDENDGHQKHRKPLLTLPETILFDNNGVMYIMNENGQLISLTDFQPKKNPKQVGDINDLNHNILTAKATEVANLGMGRPLGGQFDKHNCLYYADSLLGLARVCNLQSSSTTLTTTITTSQSNHQGKLSSNVIEIVASRVKLSDGSWSTINYADDVDIGPITGHVYFSDASAIHTDRNTEGQWDVEYSSKVEGIRGALTGRLLRYKPENGEVDVLATNAAFANGVAVDKDERYVLYTSTFEGCVMKYHLQGPTAGTVERILDNFPGFLDGADCSFDSGLCYVAIPTPISALVQTIFSLPPWLGKPVRTLLMMIPRTWAPKAVSFGAVAEIHPGNEEVKAHIVRVFQDPDGKDMSMVTGVTERDGKVYLGSLHNNHVGVLTL